MNDSYFISKALSLAHKGKYSSKPGVAVGCVIVKNKKIIGKGFYSEYGGKHAEINAINDIKNKYKGKYLSYLSGSEIFVTLEPCSKKGKTGACTNELIKYDFARIIVGAKDPTQNGIAKLKKEGYKVDLLNDPKSIELNKDFFYKSEFKRPYIRAKIAMSADKKSVFVSGKRKWITGTPARKDVQLLRANSDVILTGAGTINIDKPTLNVRLKKIACNKSFFQPHRYIFSNNLELDWNAPFFEAPGKKVIVTSKKEISKIPRKIKDISLMHCPAEGNEVDPEKFLKKISKLNFSSILLESGPKLLGAFGDRNLIDEYIFYISPERLKNKALYFYGGEKKINFFDSKQFVIVHQSKIGKDKKLILRKK